MLGEREINDSQRLRDRSGEFMKFHNIILDNRYPILQDIKSFLEHEPLHVEKAMQHILASPWYKKGRSIQLGVLQGYLFEQIVQTEMQILHDQRPQEIYVAQPQDLQFVSGTYRLAEAEFDPRNLVEHDPHNLAAVDNYTGKQEREYDGIFILNSEDFEPRLCVFDIKSRKRNYRKRTEAVLDSYPMRMNQADIERRLLPLAEIFDTNTISFCLVVPKNTFNEDLGYPNDFVKRGGIILNMPVTYEDFIRLTLDTAKQYDIPLLQK